MDIVTGYGYQKQILEQVEKDLGRSLSEDEKKVFWKASKLALLKGYLHRDSGAENSFGG